MVFESSTVDLERIRTADHTYHLTTSTDIDALVASIRTVGLLQPPILTACDDAYIVVAGFRRIAACRALNMARIPVGIVPRGASRFACARIAVADNALQRALNVVERARAYAMLQEFADDQNAVAESLQAVGLPASRSAVQHLLPIAAMPARMQASILSGRIAPPVAMAIQRLDSQDAMVLAELLDELNTGLNIQREILETIREIALRDRISITALLEQPDIASILTNGDAAKPQLVDDLRHLLKQKRFPELSRREKDFQRARKSLRLCSSIRLDHPPYFEGKTYRITINVESREQLRSLLPDLEKMASDTSLLPD